jgi:uncharacterized protein (DUF2267 family)
MDELLAQVEQKTGLDAEKAKPVVETVLAFLKERLPAMIGDQIETALSSGSESGGGLGELTKGLGSLFGK